MNIDRLQTIIFCVNLSAIIGICGVYAYSISSIAANELSQSFLLSVHNTPRAPVDIISICAIALSLNSLNIFLRKHWYFVRYNFWASTASCILEIILCVWIVVATNAVYRGIILLAASGILYFVKSRRQIITYSVFLIALYIICDYQVLSHVSTMVPFSAYLDFLPGTVGSQISLVQHILFSTNDILFIVFLFSWIRDQQSKTTLINELYNQQYRANEELKLANIQLKHYMKETEENVLVRERNRISREIHDTLGHSLTAIQAGLMSTTELAKSNLNQELLQSQLDILHKLSQKTLVDVRRSVRQLRPDVLQKQTLVQAIQEMAANITSLTDTKVAVQTQGERELPTLYEDTIFRIVQETITNSVRHGNATKIHIQMRFHSHSLHMTIQDNGKGTDEINFGAGLKGVIERVVGLMGEVVFNSADGFLVDIHIPLEGGDTVDKDTNS